MLPCFEVQKQEKPVSGKQVAQCFWLFYKQLHFYISLLFHPMMNSINLDLFKASVGETTIFVVVTAVHSGAECFSWLRPQSWIWRTQNIVSAFQTLQRDSGILIVHKTRYLLLQLCIFSLFACKGKGIPCFLCPELLHSSSFSSPWCFSFRHWWGFYNQQTNSNPLLQNASTPPQKPALFYTCGTLQAPAKWIWGILAGSHGSVSAPAPLLTDKGWSWWLNYRL